MATKPHLHLLAQRRTARRGSDDIGRPSSSVVAVDASLGAAGTSTVLARTRPALAPTLASRLLRSRHLLHRLLIRRHVMRRATVTAALAALQIGQTPSLGVDVPHLPIALRVKGRELLARRRVDGFFEVRIDAAPAHGGFVGDSVAGIEALGAVAGLVLAVELGERIGEARGDAVLVVERDRSLQGGIADDVAVREVFGDDARAGLIFLRDIVLIAGGVIAARGAAWSGAGCVARDLHLGCSELGVVEEESGLGGSGVVISMDSANGELGRTYVSFSNVTVADWVPSAPGVTESEVIFPLITGKHWIMLSFASRRTRS